MANTKNYLSHLLQNTGITPACSEEERAAADVIAKVFANHGFTPQVQEFSASGAAKVVQAALGVAVFIGAVLVGIGGPVGIVGLLLALVAAVIYTLERMGHPVFSQLGAGGLSQNVIAYHKASGPLASPRNRPVVVVAHYDSPRVDLLAQHPYATYKPLLAKAMPYAMVVPAILAVVRLFPVPGPAKVVLWLLAIVAALIPLANAVAIIANRFVLPYTTGAVNNMSSVASMLGVMDNVAPYELGEEFTSDMPADEYFAEQQRILEEAIAAAQAAAAAEVSYPHEMEEGSELEGEGSAEGEMLESALDGEGEFADAAELDELGATAMSEALAMDSLDAGATNINMPVLVDDEFADNQTATPDSTVEMSADDLAEELENAEGQDELDTESAETVVEETPATEDESWGEDAKQAVFDFDAAPEVEPADDGVAPFTVNAEGNVRYGASTIRALGMFPPACVFVYEDSETEDIVEPTAFEVEHEPVEVSYDEDSYEDESYEAESYEDEVEEYEQEGFTEEAEDESEYVAEEDTYEEEAFENDETAADENEQYEEEAYEDEAFENEVDDSVEFEASEDDQVEVEESQAEIAEEATPGYVEEELPFEDVEQEDVATVVSQNEQMVEHLASESDADITVQAPALSSAVAMPALNVQPGDTVDKLMAEINRNNTPAPAPTQNRVFNLPSTADAPKPHTPASANRASLFDLPDPSAAQPDPFASPVAASAPAQIPAVQASEVSEQSAVQARNAFTVISANETMAASASSNDDVFDRIGTISAPAPEPEKQRRGLARLFGRKKKNDDSMSQWLGVDDDFDAKASGNDIGSWDNFDDDGWKGGAAPFEGASEEEMREAIANMGDDELLGHDIWFVATGASENGNAGIRAFLAEHRDKLRGVFLINLENVGAGELSMLATEGEPRVLKGDKRIMKLMQRVSSDFHHPFETVNMPYVTTDAYPAMNMSLRSLTIGGVDGPAFALSHTEQDQPYNVDLDNVALVSDVVTEVIRRS